MCYILFLFECQFGCVTVQSDGKVSVFISIQISLYLRDNSDKSYCSIPTIRSAFTPKDFYVSITSLGFAFRKTADRILKSATHISIIMSISIFYVVVLCINNVIGSHNTEYFNNGLYIVINIVTLAKRNL